MTKNGVFTKKVDSRIEARNVNKQAKDSRSEVSLRVKRF